MYFKSGTFDQSKPTLLKCILSACCGDVLDSLLVVIYCTYGMSTFIQQILLKIIIFIAKKQILAL